METLAELAGLNSWSAVLASLAKWEKEKKIKKQRGRGWICLVIVDGLEREMRMMCSCWTQLDPVESS